MILLEPSFAVLRKSHPEYTPQSFTLVTPLVFFWPLKEINVTVPTGFVTNLASIPRALRPLFPVNDNHRLAAVVHDYLYSCGGRLVTAHWSTAPVEPYGLGSRVITYTRKEADSIFFEIMRFDGVSKLRAKLMLWGVRCFGGSYWESEDA